MTEHPDLFGLVRAELGNEDALAAGAHLDACRECRAAIVDLVVGNALLARTGRTLPDPAVEPPPLQAVGGSARRMPGRPSRRAAAALVAAVVAVLLGVGGVVWWVVQDEDLTGGGGTETALSPLRPGTSGTGSVENVTGDDGHSLLSVSVDDLPPVGEGEYYFAWLLDPVTKKLLPLGQVGEGVDVVVDLDTRVVDAYPFVDVSVERDDGDPTHSAVSVLRGDNPH
jgi:hypothetical protein